MYLKTLIWNVRGWWNKREEIKERIKNYDLVILTEIKNKPERELKIAGYKTLTRNNYNNNLGGAGGVAIIVRENLRVEINDDFNTNDGDIDCASVQVQTDQKKIINVIAIYRRPGRQMRNNTWNDLLRRRRNNESIILAGDFNAHHTDWNCEKCDHNGEILKEEMENNDMYVINTDTTSRIGNRIQRNSNLDLMFCSEEIAGLTDYQQINDPGDSDHLPIEFNIGVKLEKYRKRSNWMSSKKTSWDIYNKELMKKEAELEENEYIQMDEENKYQQIGNMMKEAVLKATYGEKWKEKFEYIDGKIKKKEEKGQEDKRWRNNRNPAQWWDEECKQVVEERKKKFKIWRRNKTMENYIELKRMKALTRKTIKKKKREDFQKFANKIDKNMSIKYVWNKMRILKNRFNTIAWNKWQGKSRKKTIEETIDNLAPPWVAENPETKKEEINRQMEESGKMLERDLTMEELNSAIRRTNGNSSPGKDGIDYKMIKMLPQKFKDELLKLLNFAFREAYMFQEWREVMTIFIDKPNKQMVRPITMSSCMLKIMEKITNDRLMWWIENQDLLDEGQNGFRKGRSCQENLMALRIEAEKGMWTEGIQ